MSDHQSAPTTIDSEVEDLITTFIMQYDQRVKIGNKRNLEAVERHKTAINNLIAQEANKALGQAYVNLPIMDDLEHPLQQSWKLGGTDVESYRRGYSDASTKAAQAIAAQLTADKEEADPSEGIKNLRDYLGLPVHDSPSNTDLRDNLWQIVMPYCAAVANEYGGDAEQDCAEVIAKIETIFQAREQELLTELLGELPASPYSKRALDRRDEDMPRGKRIALENKGYGYKQALHDVVSVIERYREGLHDANYR